jgi:hypothetical protein
MQHRVAAGLALAFLAHASTAAASDGVADSGNTYPAVGMYFVASQPVGQPLEAWAYCSGTLIAKNVFLTAAHCTFYDTVRAFDRSYAYAEAWVSFDPVALENDFRCFLIDKKIKGSASLTCDAAARTVPAPTFRKAASTGITNPDYPTIRTLGDGSIQLKELFAPGDTDTAALYLEKAVNGIAPLPTAGQGTLGAVAPAGTPLLGVGYGLDYHRSLPAHPEQPGGEGPTTFEGDVGVRRLANVGTVRDLTSDWIVPTQRNTQGEDSLCYGDSGSPLFRRDAATGAVVKQVIGVLTGGALWCMGANDPYQRVDTPSAVAFTSCLKAARSADEACRCGVEDQLGLCGAP